uniref:hypothetical protein n=1 Tax=Leyella stercorea TaxID=363265 RepID=UPI0026736DFF
KFPKKSVVFVRKFPKKSVVNACKFAEKSVVNAKIYTKKRLLETFRFRQPLFLLKMLCLGCVVWAGCPYLLSFYF